MNRKQKTAVVIGALAVVGLALFPPHLVLAPGDFIGAPDRASVLFAWTFSFPNPHSGLVPEPISMSHLLSFQFAITALTIAAVVLLADKKRPPVADTFD